MKSLHFDGQIEALVTAEEVGDFVGLGIEALGQGVKQRLIL